MTEPFTLPSEPPMIAMAFLDKKPLHYWRGDFIEWNGRHYIIVDDDTINASISQFISSAQRYNKKGELANFVSSTTLVLEVKNHIRWHLGVLIPATRDERTARDGSPMGALVSCWNGLVDVMTNTIQPHDPEYLVFSCLPFKYDPNASDPTEWIKFVHSLWPDDDGSEGGSIACLQEIMGYLLSGDLSLEKYFYSSAQKDRERERSEIYLPS